MDVFKISEVENF